MADLKREMNHEMLERDKHMIKLSKGKHKSRQQRTRKRRRKKFEDLERSITVQDKFISTCVTLLYLLYPTVTRATFKLVACQTVGKNRYLQMDLDTVCWDGKHLPWVALLFLPALFLYVVGLPVMAFACLYRHRKHLNSKIPRFHFGVIFLGFKNGLNG